MFEIQYDILPNVASLQPIFSISNISKQFRAKGFISEVFPSYPLDIILIPHHTDFINKLQIVVSASLCPKQIQVMASNNLDDKYDLMSTIKFEQIWDKKEIVKTCRFKEISPEFIKLRIMGATETSQNMAKQVSILGVKLYNQRFDNTQYLYNMKNCRQYPKQILSILCSLEYRLKHKIKEKDYQECQNLSYIIQRTLKEFQEENVKTKGRNIKDSIEANIILQQINKQYLIKDLAKQFPSDVKVRQTHKVNAPLQYLPNAAQVNEIFEHYIERVTPYYLDLLRSHEQKHNQKAILDLWNSVKHQYSMPILDQQMIFDLTLYFLNSNSNQTIKVILQVLQAFLNNDYTKSVSPSLSSELLILLCQHYPSKKDIIGQSAWQSLIVEMFSISDQDQYLDITLNSIHLPDTKKASMLYLLLKTQNITNYNSIVNYLSHLFQNNQSSSKPISSIKIVLNSILQILEEKLPTNIINPLRKQMNVKLQAGHRRNSIPINSSLCCEYCMISNPQFGDSDILSIHHFRDCVCLIKCKECQQIVEIKRMHSHSMAECENKRVFFECQQCGMAIREQDLSMHRNSCPQKKGIYCPLCLSDAGSEEGLEIHIRGKRCPRNPRG